MEYLILGTEQDDIGNEVNCSTANNICGEAGGTGCIALCVTFCATFCASKDGSGGGHNPGWG